MSSTYIHVSASGRSYTLSEMSDRHLNNTIKLIKDWKTGKRNRPDGKKADRMIKNLNWYQLEKLHRGLANFAYKLNQERNENMKQKTLHQLAYEALDPKPGEKMKVLFKVPGSSQGWANNWVPGMDNCVGGTYTVNDRGKPYDAETYGVLLDVRGTGFVGESFRFPAFCLERVEDPVPEHPKTFGDFDVRVDTERKVIAVGCERFTLKDILRIERELNMLNNNICVIPTRVKIRGHELLGTSVRRLLKELQPVIKYLEAH